MKLLLLLLSVATVQATHLIDLTPGGFVPSVTGSGDPPAYHQAQDNFHLDTALTPDFGLGPWRFTGDGGLGGTYLFSNLFTASPTSTATVSWNLFGDPNRDWMTYLIVVGGGLVNVYGVDSGQKFESPIQTVTVNGTATIGLIAFMGRNPAFPTPESGATLPLFSMSVVVLFLVGYLVVTDK
jgi:hypothetical protein